MRIDPRTGRAVTVPEVGVIGAGFGSLWAASGDSLTGWIRAATRRPTASHHARADRDRHERYKRLRRRLRHRDCHEHSNRSVALTAVGDRHHRLADGTRREEVIGADREGHKPT
jgi:hypothetical protein